MRRLVVVIAASGAALGFAACKSDDAGSSGNLPIVLIDAGDAAGGEAGGGSKGDCASKGGTCLPPSETPSSAFRKANPGEATCGPGTDVCWLPDTGNANCKTDADCGDPKAPVAWGKCFLGLCMCRSGYHVQPSGKCGTDLPADCATQGGSCVTAPATCAGGALVGSDPMNQTCGASGTCCMPAASCKGSTSFSCCAPNSVVHAARCESGWRTCPSEEDAFSKPGGC
jgi:hypothetical protein